MKRKTSKILSAIAMAALLAGISIMAFSIVQVSSQAGPFIVDEYTLALWHLDEGTGTTVYDASPHSNHGTVIGPVWTTGKFGHGLDFVNPFDQVVVPDNPDGSLDLLEGDQFTIEFWGYPRYISRPDRGSGNHWNAWIHKQGADPMPSYIVYQASYYPILQVSFWHPDSTGHSVYHVPPQTNQWTHIMTTYDGQYLRLYYNGVLQAEEDIGHHYVIGNDAPFAMGTREGTYPWKDAVDGILDEVRISSIARDKPIPATVDIYPDTLNLISNGQWITACVALPEGFSVANIDVATVELVHNNAVVEAADWGEVQDGVLTVKFDRATLRDYLGITDIDDGEKFYDITLTITGSVAGTPFEGSNIITVKTK